jgi:hypothetical protein
LDTEVLLVTVPGHVRAEGATSGSAPAEGYPHGLQQLYFVTVAESKAPLVADGCEGSMTSAAGGAVLQATTGADGAPLIAGLAMEQVLGAGSFATVYRGTWQGQRVAVKVGPGRGAEGGCLQRGCASRQGTQAAPHLRGPPDGAS